MNSLKNILGPLGSVAAAIGVISTVAGSAMLVDHVPWHSSLTRSSFLRFIASERLQTVRNCNAFPRYDVDGGQRAVLFQKFSFTSKSAGVQEGVVGEGTHFLVPWFQQAIMLVAHAHPSQQNQHSAVIHPMLVNAPRAVTTSAPVPSSSR